MDYRRYLKMVRNAIQGKVIPLDYVWRPQSRYHQMQPISQPLFDEFGEHRDQFNRYIPLLLSHLPAFRSIPTIGSDESNAVYWHNKYLPGLDLIFLYMMVKENKPARILEIGSGHSTAVMHKAIVDGNLSTQITCIDPHPRRSLNQLKHEGIPEALENLKSFEMFSRLTAGDILFFDGSHVALANSDVTVFFMEILPRLAPGVLIQIHDIYLPFDYPQDMVNRGYNEQYLLAQLLRFGWPGHIEVLFPAYWMSRQENFQKEMDSGLWDHLPSPIEKHGGSFWFTLNS